MNWLDAVLVGLLLVASLAGLRTGVIRILAAVIGTAGGAYIAGKGYAGLAPNLGFIENQGQAKIAAFALILFAVLVGVSLLGLVMRRLLSLLALGWLDRLGGLALGLILGAFLATLLVMALGFLGQGETIANSILAPFLANQLSFLFEFLPEELEGVQGVLS